MSPTPNKKNLLKIHHRPNSKTNILEKNMRENFQSLGEAKIFSDLILKHNSKTEKDAKLDTIKPNQNKNLHCETVKTM